MKHCFRFLWKLVCCYELYVDWGVQNTRASILFVRRKIENISKTITQWGTSMYTSYLIIVKTVHSKGTRWAENITRMGQINACWEAAKELTVWHTWTQVQNRIADVDRVCVERASGEGPMTGSFYGQFYTVEGRPHKFCMYEHSNNTISLTICEYVTG